MAAEPTPMTQFSYTQYVHATQAYGAQASALQAGAVDPSLSSAYAALWLRPGAPKSVVKAAYRSLAAQLHPGAGGDDRAMRRINEAYQLLNNALD